MCVNPDKAVGAEVLKLVVNVMSCSERSSVCVCVVLLHVSAALWAVTVDVRWCASTVAMTISSYQVAGYYRLIFSFLTLICL